jgi:hypothetical protein
MIMKKLLTSYILITYAFLLVSQDTESTFTYRHMKGTMGQDELVFDLMIKGTEVYGSSYIITGKTGSGYAEALSGTIDEYSIAELEAYKADEFTGTYSGRLKTYYSGIYRPENSQYGKNFEMEDDYARSIRFSGHLLSVDSALVDTAGSPVASLDFSVLLPEHVDSNTFIREAVMQAFFGNADLSDIPNDSILPAYADIYFARYIEANIDIYDGGHAFNWETTANASVILNRDNILCYRADTYAYTGGAHGMGISRFLAFDTRKNIRLQLKDLFVDGYELLLGDILERKYRDMRFMNENEPLTDAGLFDDSIHPTENFRISEEGITFSYNPYELAPYSMGSITISLRKDEITDLLKPDAAVKRLGW